MLSARRRQENGVLIVHHSGGQNDGSWGVLNGYSRETLEKKFKVHTAVDRVMAGLLCYSEGILLVELRAMCADVKKVTTNFVQTTISINFPSAFLSYRPS